MAYLPAYQDWRHYGFIPSTNLVCKRHRRDGLLDVVYRNSDGSYTTWIAQASSIWLLLTDVRNWQPFQEAFGLQQMMSCFPEEPIHYVPYYNFPTLQPPSAHVDDEYASGHSSLTARHPAESANVGASISETRIGSVDALQAQLH